MIIERTKLDGVYTIKREEFSDKRGSFGRIACAKEFEQAGLNGNFVQQSLSKNSKKGIFRGLHSLAYEYGEDKLVTCIRGKVFDIAVDVRKSSPTSGQWVGVELSEENNTALYISRGFAHGFASLTDDTWLIYNMTQFYDVSKEIGYNYKDPAFDIRLPIEIEVISDKDRDWKFI